MALSTPSAAELALDVEQPAATPSTVASAQRPAPPVLVDTTKPQDVERATIPAARNIALDIGETDDIAQAWLDTQCAIITGVSYGIVMDCPSAVGAVHPIAHWPQDRREVPQALFAAARQAVRSRSFVIQATNGDAEAHAGFCVVAWPLLNADGEMVIAALALPESMRRQQQAVVQLLQWGTSWFELLRREQRTAVPQERLVNVVELLASSLQHAEFDAAAGTAVTELAARLSCSRVSLGLLRGRQVEVCAISNSAKVDTRSNLVRDIASAMDEAVDQDATTAYPPLADALPHVSFAQEVLARRGDGAAVFSTPLYDGTRVIGALTVERDGDDGFDAAAVEVCESLGALLGPVIELKHDKERWIGVKVAASLRDFVTRLCGRRHVALKLYSLALVAFVAFFSVATGDYRVTAQARLEGSVKRMVTAPLAGFVASAERRAGDTVQAGDVLATLDDRELRLEQLKGRSQSEQLDKEYRAAVTGHDRSKAAILRAQRKQIDAQLALIDEQLARTRLTAPFGGIVLSGDLSQSLGSPVEHGQVLFEIAPLDSYRVIIEIDERDIGDITDRQRGELTLTGLPDTTLPFTVTRIVPMSTTREGRNFFEVRAQLDDTAVAIRPGMEGVAKVLVEQRKLVWIWTHSLIDWLRLSLWTWIS